MAVDQWEGISLPAPDIEHPPQIGRLTKQRLQIPDRARQDMVLPHPGAQEPGPDPRFPNPVVRGIRCKRVHRIALPRPILFSIQYIVVCHPIGKIMDHRAECRSVMVTKRNGLSRSLSAKPVGQQPGAPIRR